MKLKRWFIAKLWSALKGIYSLIMGLLLYPQNPLVGSERNGRESSSSDIAHKGSKWYCIFPKYFIYLSSCLSFSFIYLTAYWTATVLGTWNTKMNDVGPWPQEALIQWGKLKKKINHYFFYINAKKIFNEHLLWVRHCIRYRNTKESQTDKVPILWCLCSSGRDR